MNKRIIGMSAQKESERDREGMGERERGGRQSK